MDDNKKQEIVEQLKISYWMEIETIINYIGNSLHMDGIRAQEVKEILTMEVDEELNHARSLAKRIKELGGHIPGSMDFKPMQQSLQPPKDTTDLRAVVQGVIDAEKGAIQQYLKIAKMCDGVDYVTQDLAIGLMGDEEEHRSIFEGFMRGLDADNRNR